MFNKLLTWHSLVNRLWQITWRTNNRAYF